MRLAPLPRNITGHGASRFRAGFSCVPVDGVRVTLSISFDFRAPMRWLVEPVVRRTMSTSVERELRLVKELLEGPTPPAEQSHAVR